MASSVSASGQPALAPRACFSCRKRRRRCNRRLPSCFECQELGRKCEYALWVQSTTQGVRKGRLEIVKHTPQRSNAKLTDAYLPKSETAYLRLYRLSGSKVDLAIPRNTLHLLGGSHAIPVISADYMRMVHPWMPIVSTMLLQEALSNKVTEPRADLILLLLCMKLVTQTPAHSNRSDMRTVLYRAVKQLYGSIESAGTISTQFLQASVLISLYELGHAIYPEANLSVTASAKLGIALGLNNQANHKMVPPPSSWIELEERTRTWWGVVILDRYVSLGIRGRPLAATNLKGIDYVPVNNMAWEQDVPPGGDAQNRVITDTTHVGVFAREAHASNLLGQAVELKLCPTGVDSSPDGFVQLERTIQALSLLLEHDLEDSNGAYFCGAVAMCNSALMTLHAPAFLQGSGHQPSSTLRALILCKRAADRVLELGKEFFGTMHLIDLETIAPLVPDSIYQAAVIYGFLFQKTREKQYLDAYDLMRESLVVFGKRWKVACEYLKILDLQQLSK